MRKLGRILLLPVAALVTALLWTTLGSFSTASGQDADKPMLIDRAHAGSLRPTFDEPVYVLVIGGDGRTGNPDNARADSLHIVAIDPVSKRGSIVGLPRDSFVDVVGRGNDKIAHALFFGGAEGTVATVERVSGCRFDYFMLVSFEGFRGKRGEYRTGGLINELGGITMRIPTALNARLPFPVPAGKVTLNGGQALTWSRDRKSSQRPRGDFDRSEAQGELLVAILNEMRADFKQNPGTIFRNMAAARRNITMNIGLTESLELGLMALQIRPRNVKNIVVDGIVDSDPRAGSIVRITSKGLSQLADVCADGILDAD